MARSSEDGGRLFLRHTDSLQNCKSYEITGRAMEARRSAVRAVHSVDFVRRAKQVRNLSGPYSRDGSECVNVIGVISEPFAREFR